MGIAGSGVHDPNFRLRFFAIVFMSILAFSAVEFWKESLFAAAEYQPLPVTHEQNNVRKENIQKRKSLTQKLIQTEE